MPMTRSSTWNWDVDLCTACCQDKGCSSGADCNFCHLCNQGGRGWAWFLYVANTNDIFMHLWHLTSREWRALFGLTSNGVELQMPGEKKRRQKEKRTEGASRFDKRFCCKRFLIWGTLASLISFIHLFYDLNSLIIYKTIWKWWTLNWILNSFQCFHLIYKNDLLQATHGTISVTACDKVWRSIDRVRQAFAAANHQPPDTVHGDASNQALILTQLRNFATI